MSAEGNHALNQDRNVSDAVDLNIWVNSDMIEDVYTEEHQSPTNEEETIDYILQHFDIYSSHAEKVKVSDIVHPLVVKY